MMTQTTINGEKDKRYADYSNRPLTEEEKEFAADSKNYDKLFQYMKVHKLDQSEWYDILIIPYLNSVKKYMSIPRLQKHDFGAILFVTLDNAKFNYYRSMNSKLQQNTYSLDWESDDTDSGTKIAPTFWIDIKQSVEKTVLFHEMISVEIFIRLIEEYGKEEIREELNINRVAYYKKIKEIKQVVIDYLSM